MDFWLDVGGTFTDCFMRRPSGELSRHKVLSSGLVKGVAGQGTTAASIVDLARCYDPPNFWRGARIHLLDDEGRVVETDRIAEFHAQSGELVLTQSLAIPPAIGMAYELDAGLDAPILAIRHLLGLAPEEPIPPVQVKLGTTRGTNALLTRRGARAALVTTRGFADILKIGYQNRPKLFERNIRKPAPLHESVAEIDERIAADGAILQSPNAAQVRGELARLKASGIESLAICLLNSYADPRHERFVGEVAREIGFAEVRLSSAAAPLIKIVARGDTALVDAYLNPILRDYVARLRTALGEHSQLRLLTSAGGLVTADRFHGQDSILSGPAGGVVGFSRAAQAAGITQSIGFDMGGTSTDVSRFDGRFELEYETTKAGVRVVAPMLSIETVAAGGGSVCRFDGVKLVVGPDSAGADPGPACYGRGGPLTVTDLNVLLGKIPTDLFPFPLNLAAAKKRLGELNWQVLAATQRPLDDMELAHGLVRVANANMAQAIRSISVARGYDVREYALVSFGGAGGQHACAVADELGMRRILNHPDAGLLSALGMGLADVVRHRVRGIYKIADEVPRTELDELFSTLVAEVSREVLAEGIPAERIRTRRSLDLRYKGQDAFLNIELDGSDMPGDARSFADDFIVNFTEQHQRLYGYTLRRSLEIVAARAEAIGKSDVRLPDSVRGLSSAPQPSRFTLAWFHAQAHETPVYVRGGLPPGSTITGPAILMERCATTVIDPGWRGEVLTGGELLLVRCCNSDSPETLAPIELAELSPVGIPSAEKPTAGASPIAASPIDLEIFNNHFAGIAEQMGLTLRNTASSVNVKERLDFSCAIFTAAGELVVNAPHIPVHLGAMGQTVRRVLADNPALAPGDVLVTNDPYRGGSHLPDITVVTPIHDPATGKLLMFTASRAHHAEIGGITPGSMPPFSRNLAEEGVLIRNFKAIDAGASRLDELRELLLNAPHPSRAVDDNIADLTAQIAANRSGANALLALARRVGTETLLAYMRHIQTAAEQKMRAALLALPDGRREFRDCLDDGTPICVAITIADDRATIDFTGTGGVLAGNLNANRAIVTAAVMYVLRLLLAEEIPLNEGVLAPVEIILPTCLLNPPEHEDPRACAAIVGGNVETSQRVVDVLLGALGLAAASQGTMNNLLFGDSTFGYYETICGGSGATATGAGADAVHTHMTNTRLTDPEVLEKRYPVRVREFAIRRGSGGAGEYHGGNGVIRRIEFLKPLTVSLLTQRRGAYPPFGLAGGSPGAIGRNYLTRADGRVEPLPGQAQIQVETGDVLTVETPGGGGFGKS